LPSVTKILRAFATPVSLSDCYREMDDLSQWFGKQLRQPQAVSACSSRSIVAECP
jgi:hypothetical protein